MKQISLCIAGLCASKKRHTYQRIKIQLLSAIALLLAGTSFASIVHVAHPVNGERDVKINTHFHWSHHEGLGYEIRLRQITGPGGAVVSLVLNDVRLNGWQNQTYDLNANGIFLKSLSWYRVKVRAVRSDGTLGDFSASVEFETKAPLHAPVIIRPTDGKQNTSIGPIVQWGAVDGGSHYEVKIKKLGGGLPSETYDSGIVNLGEETSFRIGEHPNFPLLDESTDYLIKVRRWSNVRGGTWDEHTVKTVPPLDIPLISAPAEGQTLLNLRPTIQWFYADGTGNPDFYTVELQFSDGTTVPGYQPSFTVGQGYSYPLPTALPQGRAYRIRIKGHSDPRVSDWTPWRNFSTLAYEPEIAVVGNNRGIVNGDNSPGTPDGTLFPNTDAGTTVSRNFVIRNDGNANLSIGTIQDNSGVFTITQAVGTLAPGASGTFTVRFNPTAAVSYTARIDIPSNDADENPFSFFVRGTGLAPEIQVKGNGANIADGDPSPRIADFTLFPNTQAGNLFPRTFTIHNLGTGTLTISQVSTTHSKFFLSNVSNAIAPGGTGALTVNFVSATPGTFSSTISIGNNDSNENPYTFVVRATAFDVPDAAVSYNGNPIADGSVTPSPALGTLFPTTPVGASVARTFRLGNTGNATLSGITVSDNSSQFSVSGLATSVSPGGSDQFVIRFTPTSAGIKTATITIRSNDPDEDPYTFVVRGTGSFEPDAQVIRVNSGNDIVIVDGDTTPESADSTLFPSALVGQTVTRRYYLENTGNATLNVTSLSANTPHFCVENIAPFSVAPGARTPFLVHFEPTAVGLRSATIRIDSNDPDENPYTFVVMGEGLNAPDAEVSRNGIVIPDGDNTPSTSDGTVLANTLVGMQSVRTFQLRNRGNATLFISSSSVNSSQFSISGLATQIAPGGGDTFKVHFHPTVVGQRAATIRIFSNDTDENPYSFTVSGLAVGPEIEITRGSLVILDGDNTPTTAKGTFFPDTLLGQASIRTFQVRNRGNLPLVITSVGDNSTQFRVTGVPQVIQPGGGSTFRVYFEPTVSGTRTATISISSQDADESPYTFTVRGIAFGSSPRLSSSPDKAKAASDRPPVADLETSIIDLEGPEVMQFEAEEDVNIFSHGETPTKILVDEKVISPTAVAHENGLAHYFHLRKSEVVTFLFE